MEQLKQLRATKGLTQSEMADLLGITQPAYNRYESGKRKLDPDTLSKLADYFEVSIDQLLGKQLMAFSTLGSLVANEVETFKPVRIQRLPLLGNIAAGKPIFANEEHEMMVETEIRADFCLKVVGDSMIGAGIMDGDVVMIRKQPMVQNGEIAAVLIDDEATLKRFYKTDSLITLISENPAYPPIVYKPEDGRDILILGKAVGLSRIFK